MDERTTVIQIVDKLRSHGLEDYFTTVVTRGSRRDWFFLAPQNLAEKASLDALVQSGLVVVTEREFRVNLEGTVVRSEFICRFTELGRRTAVFMGLSGP